jgi:6-phosphofructokinase 1
MNDRLKKIAVLTSGGDSQGMNAAIYAVVRYGLSKGLEVFGVKRGYQGLIEGDIVKMDAMSVDGIIHRGGTMLRTSRCLEFKTEAGQKKAFEQLQKYEIDGLVVIGGDGSFQGAKVLATKYGIRTMGIPGTIDNDLAYTDYTLGFDSAVNAVMDTIIMLRDTMTANNRTCVVEVMGRNCGDIALYAGLTSGAEIIVVPEVQYEIDDIVMRLEHNIAHGKCDNIIVLAEGAGNAEDMVKEIKQRMAINIRSMVVGHLQRGGDASFADRLLGVRMGRNAVQRMIEGLSNRVLGVRNSKIINEDIVEALAQRKTFDYGLYELANKLVETY